jgi:hypothetical protein
MLLTRSTSGATACARAFRNTRRLSHPPTQEATDGRWFKPILRPLRGFGQAATAAPGWRALTGPAEAKSNAEIAESSALEKQPSRIYSWTNVTTERIAQLARAAASTPRLTAGCRRTGLWKMATSTIRNATLRPWLTTFAPILISFSFRLVGEQSLIGSGVASVRRSCSARDARIPIRAGCARLETLPRHDAPFPPFSASRSNSSSFAFLRLTSSKSRANGARIWSYNKIARSDATHRAVALSYEGP